MLLLNLIFVAVFIAVMFHYASTLTWLVIRFIDHLFLTLAYRWPLNKKKVESEYESNAGIQPF